jgi:integrase
VARPKSPKPAYCHHKPSGRAFVKIDGKFTYLGDYGTQASRDEYDRVIGEWIARGRQPAQPTEASPEASATVAVVISAFWAHARTYYVSPDGTPSGELENFRLALRPLRRLYGPTPAAAFGPLALKNVRAEMLKERTITHPKTKKVRVLRGWCRTHTNRQVARLKQVFKWAVEQELVPGSVHYGLLAVSGLRKGRGQVRESKRVRPVPDADVDATLTHLSPHLQAMVKLQRLTGMRSSELCTMTTGAIDRTGALWVYKPVHHKTEHHDIEREIYLNSEAQEVVRPFLKLDPDAYVFSPADAEAQRREKQRAERKTPVQPSQVRRAEKAKRRNRRRPPGKRYTRESYRKAVERACRKAGVPRWHPHRLRHSFGTRIRKAHGIEVARILLGHSSPAVTVIYAEADREKAMTAMTTAG